jgi:hypothetical protein
MPANQVIALCAIVQIVALIVVGVVSDGFARHVLQTAPTWIALTAAVNGSRWAKWAALPVFLFWIGIAVLIWLFLLGIARIASGHYSGIEIAMTIVFAAAGVVGIGAALRERSGTPAWAALIIFVVVAAVQVGVMAASFRYPISNDTALVGWLRGL